MHTYKTFGKPGDFYRQWCRESPGSDETICITLTPGFTGIMQRIPGSATATVYRGVRLNQARSVDVRGDSMRDLWRYAYSQARYELWTMKGIADAA